MIKKSIPIILFVLVSCISGQKKEVNKTKNVSNVLKTLPKPNIAKQKVRNNSIKEAVKRTKKFANNLHFDIDYIRNRGLADKKFLAEYLGLFLKLKKYFHNSKTDEEIIRKLKPVYAKIEQKEFHNMANVDDKLFKKNSMSYMRIMWLLDQLGYDITDYKKEFFKIKKRMDDHMKLRGEWQRAVFDKYYDYFKLKKPTELLYAKKLKGPIDYRKPFEFYDRAQAYILTHFVFVAYDYGNAINQKRFDKDDLKYLSEILPQLINKFEAKNNDDLVGELLTCQVLTGQTKTPAFKQSFNRLLNRQNRDGSFGFYEKFRKRIGDEVEFRAYLHTTLVAIEPFIEYDYRKNKMIKN